MNLLRFFTRRRPQPQTAPAARERLQILLTHERSSGTQPDLVAILREEILTAIGKHVKIDADKVEVRVERGAAVSTLEIEVEVPVVGTRTKDARDARDARPKDERPKAMNKKRGKAA